MPGKSCARLNAFQQLLIVKTFRPDRLASTMTQFVTSSLNVRSIAPPPFSLKNLIDSESGPLEPILFITTPGADPSQELSEYASTVVGKSGLHELAMGQGQAEKAISLLRDCARDGNWLLLKNVHLAVSWLPSLEKELRALPNPHDRFRLFLTSEPHNKFPTTLLENSLKVTFEAPPGLKKNLQRTYEAWPAEVLQGPGGASASPIRAQLLFVLAWFHAVVQERRTYIPQGWTKFYEFSFADLRSGMDVVALALSHAQEAGQGRQGQGAGGVQWQLLHGLLFNAIYGGRLDNDFDSRVLLTYLKQLFADDIIGTGGGRVRPLPGSKVVVPTSSHRQDYLAIISSLADTDVPALFSLPDNIDRTAQQAASSAVLASLKAMSLRADAGGGFSRSLWSQQLGPLLRLWDQLMGQAAGLKQALRDIRSAVGNTSINPAAAAAAGGSEPPLHQFVALERQAGAALIMLVDKSLAALARVLKGTDTLSSGVQATGAALLADTVPAAWDSLWEGPEAPMDYCRAIVSKALAVETWWQRCQGPGGLLGAGGAGGTAPPLELSALYHPSTFLNALRQQASRQLGAAMDTLQMVTCWDAVKLAGLAGGAPVAAIGGLVAQGAAFDGQRLAALQADSPAVRAIPPMYVAWLPKTSPLAYSQHMGVPLYATSQRTKLLAQAQMPVTSTEEADMWALSGLALLLQGT